MVDYIKRPYSGQKIHRIKDFIKVDVESYDPNHIYYKYGTEYRNTSNAKTITQDGFTIWTPNNTNNTYTITATYNIQETGIYRIEAYHKTQTNPDTLNIKINNNTLKNIQTQSKDTFIRKTDLGTHLIPKGTHTITITGKTGFITLYMKKIRETTGDTENNGQITILNAKVTKGLNGQPDTLEMKIKHEHKPYQEGGFIEPGNPSGLIYEYRDPINLYVTTRTGKQKQIFGGYISSAITDEDLLTITINAAGRLIDAENKHILKEISIGGETSENTPIYKAPTLYDALQYCLEAIELPITQSNIQEIKNQIPSQKWYRINYKNKTDKKRLTCTNIIKTINTNTITLRNTHKKGSTQYAILWDSTWNKTEEKKGYLLNDKPIFFIEYGLGNEASDKPTKVYIPKKLTKTGKVRKGTGIYKTVPGKVGYDKSKPFQAWIEIQYSLTPTGTRQTRTIKFTASQPSTMIGEIKPVWENNTIKTGEINLLDILTTLHGTGNNFYIRRIALKYIAPNDNNLYDPKSTSKVDNSSYKMLLKSTGFRQGEPIQPELLQSSGRKISELLNNINEKLETDITIEYNKERSKDKLKIIKPDPNRIFEAYEGQDGNIWNINNISYPPVQKHKNTITKVYKDTDKTNKYVTIRDPATTFRYGSHEDVEVLNDKTGIYYATYKAKTDKDQKTTLKYTYTITLDGFHEIDIGDFVITNFFNNILNDVTQVKSITYNYDTDKRPMGTMEIGLDELSPEIQAKMKFSKLRKMIEPRKTIFSGGAVEAVPDTSINMFED